MWPAFRFNLSRWNKLRFDYACYGVKTANWSQQKEKVLSIAKCGYRLLLNTELKQFLITSELLNPAEAFVLILVKMIQWNAPLLTALGSAFATAWTRGRQQDAAALVIIQRFSMTEHESIKEHIRHTRCLLQTVRHAAMGTGPEHTEPPQAGNLAWISDRKLTIHSVP